MYSEAANAKTNMKKTNTTWKHKNSKIYNYLFYQ